MSCCEVKIVKYVFAIAALFSNGILCAVDQSSLLGVAGALRELNKNDANHAIKRSTFCPATSQCVPLSQCPILNNVIDNQCVLTDRIGDLGCGYQGSGLICCPQISDPNTIAPNSVVDGQRCGASQVQGDGYDSIGAFPWVVRIGFRNVLTGEVKYPCTGSILNNRVILTAAHCALAKADNYKLFLVRAGEWDSQSDIDCGPEFCGLPVQDIAISHVVVHPGYQKQTYRHNIALLVLRSKLNYTVTAQPICLPEPWSVTSNNGLLVGWGKTAGQLEAPSLQQALSLPIISLQQCIKVYGRTLPVSEEQVCAGGQQGNDACSGFGGAPLMVKHGDTFYQVGILSFGSDQCGASGVPSVYTNIKKYVTWIRENTPTVYNN
ncbi:CLIP domain-containing serine protease 14D [Aethina tumida]|uniref:CLIP domain-containing serine protease 14D n=1 Tax=Aethina tumida TaxID=116153 RepID=UPI00096ADEB9|nr:CLIP domain-containing serine protease 14D [Aethina tumida]